MHTGEWLQEGRLASGLSLVDIVIKLREELPRPLWISTDTVRKIEFRSDPDPILAAALGRIYGKAPDDWPAELREAVDQVRLAIFDGATVTDERSGSSVDPLAAAVAA